MSARCPQLAQMPATARKWYLQKQNQRQTDGRPGRRAGRQAGRRTDRQSDMGTRSLTPTSRTFSIIQCMGVENWSTQGTDSWHLWPFRQEARLSPAIPSFWKWVTMKRQWLQAGNSSAQRDVPSIAKQHLRSCHLSTLSHLLTRVHCSAFAKSAAKPVYFDMAVCLGLQLVGA